ncbi:hypothetical protein FKW77_004849 [Venturia effusa]|uniref:Uncharacterized protein n=1 Tax=Venturia effusa TaxID=50376 RepID=A0A517LIN1_9PEZI|nr:hypothetical protein FKW77_004849 [Venturia effusa]
MGAMILGVIASLMLINTVWTQPALHFTDVPDTGVVVGKHYNIEWTGGDHSSVCIPIILTLQRGEIGDAEDVTEFSIIAGGYSYDFVPGSDLDDGDNYLLRVSQGAVEDFSSVFSLYGGRKAAASSPSPATEFSIVTTSTRSGLTAMSAAEASLVTDVLSAVPAQITSTSGSSNTVKILVPFPTSSFDAPREEDFHMTINDKFALGFGIPVVLLVLSTLGYWRAIKYFLHRKVTGEPKLPVYESYENARTASKPDSRGSWSSQPASLWGAASRRGSLPPFPVQGAFSDSTELLTTPKTVHTHASARLSQGSSRAPNQTPPKQTPLKASLKMSAPNQGRQSPEPETQTDAQKGQQAQPNEQEADTTKSSDPKETLKGLESNPEHILAKSAEEKTSKK